MQILEHGIKSKDFTLDVSCPKCACRFVAGASDLEITEDITRGIYVKYKCPECGYDERYLYISKPET